MDFREKRQEIGPVRLTARQRQGSRRHAMVGTLKGEEGDPPGVVLGQLDSALDCVGPSRAAEEKAAQLGGENAPQDFNQGSPSLARNVQSMRQVGHLEAGGFQDLRVAVTDVEHSGAAEKVDIDVAIDVLHGGPPATAHGHRETPGIRYCRALMRPRIFEEYLRLRPRGRCRDQRRPGVGELFEAFIRDRRIVHRYLASFLSARADCPGGRATCQLPSRFRRASLASAVTAFAKIKKDFLATWVLVMAPSFFL